ncbi:hypothetical protein DdX_19817 [Ditylenchus destructor]|uniref:Uncharacterized protein n=1 Tax=Ditylenchus destructor TaxID=166010 RepID=A0AAD4QWT5_9BILA|nr:hypothetical protein DdX_19817 [Ditylenchus destructor]
MNLECHVCTGNKIATSFHSLDDIQAHLFSNHLDGPLDVFQFVCQNCEFKFATEYRLLRHEQTCGRESRSEEDMEKIRYKLQMYEMLEESLKYNMTKHQISGVQKNSKKNGSAETAGASPSVITNESTDNLGNLRTVKAEVQDQICTATNTQSNVKTEPEDVDTSEVEVLGTVEKRKRKAPSKSAEHISQSKPKFEPFPLTYYYPATRCMRTF